MDALIKSKLESL
jgi:CTD small phosphatase-like protein 2